METTSTSHEREGQATRRILDTNIAMDRDSGMITAFSLVEYPPLTERSFQVLQPLLQDFELAINISVQLRKKGNMLGAVDTLIAAMSINRSATLITADKGFNRIKEIIPSFKLLFS